jgi:hypothetical protein
MANPTGRGDFKKGKSGNPGGRPRMRKQARLRHPEILGMRAIGWAIWPPEYEGDKQYDRPNQ